MLIAYTSTVILIVLLGQTCSGKSELAVELAHLIGNSWIVNCDSRQIYKQLNIGTGKVDGVWVDNRFAYKEIPHFLIDYADPAQEYTLVDYIQDLIDLCNQPAPRLPDYLILTGGTGLYAKAIYDQYDLGLVKTEHQSDFEHAKQTLRQTSLRDLQAEYLELITQNSSPYQLNSSDFGNPRRLQSWILKYQAKKYAWFHTLDYPQFDRTYIFAIQTDQDVLKNKIQQRISLRVEQGLYDEVTSLQYLGQNRLNQLGLEYRLTTQFIHGEIDELTWKQLLYQENWQYAKRQLTWLKKEPVTWINSTTDCLSHISKHKDLR